MRPHKILGDDEYFWINRWLGENVDNAVYGEVVKTVLELGYKKLANFPKSSKREEIAWTQQRVAALDWEGFEQDIRSTKAPIFLSYALDDHILQPERFRELQLCLFTAGLSAVQVGDASSEDTVRWT